MKSPKPKPIKLCIVCMANVRVRGSTRCEDCGGRPDYRDVAAAMNRLDDCDED